MRNSLTNITRFAPFSGVVRSSEEAKPYSYSRLTPCSVSAAWPAGATDMTMDNDNLWLSYLPNKYVATVAPSFFTHFGYKVWFGALANAVPG